MNEKEWAAKIEQMVGQYFASHHPELSIRQGARLAYANEVRLYDDTATPVQEHVTYETDLMITEACGQGKWKPRIVIECKIASVTTHDAITYSEKAFSHKRVHPYLRYGIMLGRQSLPGRLFRHGLFFDFMMSWMSETPSPNEREGLLEVIRDEVEASRKLEEILYNTRSKSRQRHMILHRPLILKS